ncbi:MAG: efflux RND transporter periplasmic adaptor subunit [Winogradskyella sp.]|uniref:efflux RND transporter periplasmic adaptor subunit n=1 Tax=Winogradskyella sp. TaxID=1883156 RepID=UPI00184AC216|nr:efflux RND transporter periplasmic adaptor subunit [Winogradskyella sp.]MBT8245811.1 efflux RND transporter periplasmic adaptor subunit [Winogradskyella sp.]NNK22424.1 efflux RND transporter periplasmic adaptor subunit [Winogradskyella sp.]
MKNIYILLFSLAFLACGNKENNTEAVEDNKIQSNSIIVTKLQFESQNMVLDTLKPINFDNTIEVTGMIDVPPKNKSSVTTFIGGYISKTPLLVGDEVKKGQLLVSLKNPEYVEIQQNYLEITEQLSYLKAEFNRQRSLFAEQITSEKNYLKAQSAYKSNLATYNGLSKKLQMMNINPNAVEQGQITSTINLYAPISGHITKVNVSNGTYVSPSNIIIEIVDIDHIHLELSVFEKDIMKIKKGQKIAFKVPEASNKSYEAEVHLVGTTIDETTRRIQVHGHVDKDLANFIVGMFVEATIIIAHTESLSLPNQAIVNIDREHSVLILDKNVNEEYHFKRVKVRLGKQNENSVEILNTKAFTKKQILVKGIGMLMEGNTEE